MSSINPLVFKLPSTILEEFDKNDNIILSNNINKPKMELGFHYYLHKTKTSMSIIDKLNHENNFYYIMNNFEAVIIDYVDNLNNSTDLYLNNQKLLDIKTHNFYILWEMLFIFDLFKNKNINYISINDNSNEFIQCVIFYNKKITENVKCKLYNYNVNKYDLSPEFIKKYKITDNHISTIQTSMNKSKEFADLITINGTLDLQNTDIFEEQKSYKLLLSEIILALKLQSKSGNLILRLFETFTTLTIKLIYIISNFYNNIYIHKPYYSRLSNSDKYLICKDFKYERKDSNLLEYIDSLDACFKKIDDKLFLFDIYPKLKIPNDYLNYITFINTKLVNLQQININEIIKFIKENNYFGDKYHQNKIRQIKNTEWWINMFYPPSRDIYNISKDNINKLILTTIEKYYFEFNKFNESLII